MDVVEANTGILPVDDRINRIQDLSSDKIVIQESGYLEVFVNNETQTPVYYDNLVVMQSTGNVIEVNAYYPYGKIIQGLSTSSTYGKNNYKYNGKELQTDMELNWLDYGWRPLPTSHPVWFVPDPMIELHYEWSPYAYCYNNPINLVDPLGLDTTAINRDNWSDFDPDNDVAIMPEVTITPNNNNGNGPSYALNLSLPQSGDQVMPPLRGTWAHIKNFISPRTYGRYAVNTQGQISGLAPITGIAPTPWKINSFGVAKTLSPGRFPRLDFKFGKHSDEWSQWGIISKLAYYKRAVKLADSSVGGNILGFTSKQGCIFRFNKSTGEFLTKHPSGYIETFFRPKQGMDYYLKQVQMYGI